MKRRGLVLGVALVLVASAAWYYTHRAGEATLVLTGIVTTDDLVVSAQVGGQIAELAVKEGDAVTKGQRLATIVPDELRADSQYFAHAAEGASSAVQQSEAALRFQEQQTQDQIQQAEANVASLQAQQASLEADLDNAKTTYERTQKLLQTGSASQSDLDQARTAYDAARARVASLVKQVESARSAVAMARSNAEQVAMRRSQLAASRQQSAAAAAQRQKADVRLGYTELRAPIDGLVDVRAALQGEVVGVGQPVVTLVNPDNLWVRSDVEETYIDRVRIGDHLAVRLPSGDEREGTVFYRGVDAGYATQRDVSRTKRDIKTFEVRLRVDNRDRRLAVGMTAYVLLPLK
jgi:HlyD family secretion protein